MKKLIALLLALAMLVTLSACGGKKTSDPDLGKYIGTTVEVLGQVMPISDIYDGENYVELKSGGKYAMMLDGDTFEGKWTRDGKNIVIKIEGNDSPGTLSDGVLSLDFMGLGIPITFVKEGISAPESSKDTSGENTFNTQNGAKPDSSWWSGDWYGWWIATDAGGEYTDWADSYWDACARIEVFEDGTGHIQIWDEDCTADLCFVEADVSFGTGTTDYGCMMSESGSFWDAEIDRAEWIVDPGASPVSEIEHMICIEGTFLDPDDNGESYFDYTFYLRPWGMKWEDVRNADTTNLPYDDMMPKSYDSWYLPLLTEGTTNAPDRFGDTGNLTDVDDLIYESYNDAGEYTVAYGEDNSNIYYYSYHLPMFTASTDGARAINDSINSTFGTLIENQYQEMENGMDIGYNTVSWFPCFYQDLFTLLIVAESNFGYSYYGVYCYEQTTGEWLQGSALLEYLNIEESEFLEATRQAAEECFVSYYGDVPEEDREEYGYYDQLAWTVSDENINCDNLMFYPDFEGEIVVIAPIGSIAGAEWYYNFLYPEISYG